MFAYLGDVILVDKLVSFGNIIFTRSLENKQRKIKMCDQLYTAQKLLMYVVCRENYGHLTLLFFLVIKNIPLT